jgi:hypothetical protein
MNAIPFKPKIAPQSYQSARNGYFKGISAILPNIVHVDSTGPSFPENTQWASIKNATSKQTCKSVQPTLAWSAFSLNRKASKFQWILNQTKPKRSQKRFVLQLWLPAQLNNSEFRTAYTTVRIPNEVQRRRA